MLLVSICYTAVFCLSFIHNPRQQYWGINKKKANCVLAKLDLFLNITNYMNTTHSYTCIKVLTRIFFSSKSIPISHNPSGRWDKCRQSPWPVMRRKMRKKMKKREKAWPVRCSVRPEFSISRETWRTLEWMMHRGAQLLHSVLSFHSVLCLFF